MLQPESGKLKREQSFHGLEVSGAIAIKQSWKSFHQNALNWQVPNGSGKQRFISIVGCLLIGIGIATWNQPLTFYSLIHLLFNTLDEIVEALPHSILAMFILIAGAAFILSGYSRSTSSKNTFHSKSKNSSLDSSNTRQFNQESKIVVIGGGTGLSTLLHGLKSYSSDITAVVTVADDGGSSGRLRREWGILPLGDIRSCMTALADEKQTLTELFQFRFQQGEGLVGHSFGNLFLAAMNTLTGDLEQAITACAEILKIQGQVLPATLSDIHLWAELSDGRRIEGESHITAAKGQIAQIGCTPADPPALPAVLEAIAVADYIILGPGSLYTSVIPNLLVPEIREAIARATVPRIYICNIMTQAGETNGYRVSDHIRALERVCGTTLIDSVLIHQGKLSPRSLAVYAEEGSYPVVFDREVVKQLNCQVILDDIAEIDPSNHSVRHHSQRLAKSLERWLNR
ncbi:MAG: YvcK family protein [Leptolyngbyaceae cyanobacterium CSU_1_4]|nr:YvcK family protein [Leptolyngbyaceae cyanobacterium CSU_1_4]